MQFVEGLFITMHKIKSVMPDVLTKSAEAMRTSVVLPHVLEQNLSLWATKNGLRKGEVIRLALHEYLKSKGLQPDKEPKIKLTYE